MPESSTHQTWQKRVIQAAIDGLDTPFTMKDICETLADSGPYVSRATIYRALRTLCAEGRVREIFLPDGRRVCAHPSAGTAVCIIECMDCGRLSSCDASEVDRCLNGEALRRHMNPLQTSAYMQAKCDVDQCKHRESCCSTHERH